MKVRVLYPIALRDLFFGSEPEAGAVVEVESSVGDALVTDGAAEEVAARTKVTAKPERPKAAARTAVADPEADRLERAFSE